MEYAKESLRLHYEWMGKIEVISTVPGKSKNDLSKAVAEAARKSGVARI